MSHDPANQTTLGNDAFVSYASQDATVANSIVESLESQGLKCWIAPRDVKPGAQYADAIVRAINEAKAVVLVMSGSAVASSHVGRKSNAHLPSTSQSSRFELMPHLLITRWNISCRSRSGLMFRP
ncbi:MAG: toll/interleukin-1 receptor domain-containing protein [Steroidobacteraceae bacterium]